MCSRPLARNVMNALPTRSQHVLTAVLAWEGAKLCRANRRMAQYVTNM
jgi:hypothetical protein